MSKKIFFSVLFFFSFTGCTQVQAIDSKVYECVSGNSNYIKRCELNTAKNTYLDDELKYYFQQVGKAKFEKEIKEYTHHYIQTAEQYCAINTSFAFVVIPQDKNKIYEETASCLKSQYIQLGKNLRTISDKATDTIIKRINQLP